MKGVPSYPKVLILGSTYTADALTGEVIIQEKVDGSQFGFGLNENKEIVFRSRHVSIDINYIPNMFKKGVEHIIDISDRIKTNFSPGTYFYAEYLEKPKHNVLRYERIPKNHLVLFDVISYGKWLRREELVKISEILDIDIVPELYRGKTTAEQIKELLNTPSFLGGETIEGVVIKNYNQTVLLGGNVFPLFTKFVREKFKERLSFEWQSKRHNRNTLQEYYQSFCTIARWEKAYMHLLETGQIEQRPQDITKLINEVKKDIVEEEKENIKRDLYKMFIKDIMDHSVKGLAEWYKEKLLNNVDKNKI